MKAYRASCDTCGFTDTRPTGVEARRALRDHRCQQRCTMCGHLFPLLVDDGPLCISCDALLFPTTPPLRRIA